MTSTHTGVVENVVIDVLGDELAADVIAGATTLTLVDTADFNEDGGWLMLGAEKVAYASVDDDNAIITLSTGLAAAYTTGAFVFSLNRGQKEMRVKTAYVANGEGDAIPANVPHALWDKLQEGVRDPTDIATGGETVTAHRVGGDWLVADVLGQEPAIDGAYITPSTMPSDFYFIGNIGVDQLTSGTLSANIFVNSEISTRSRKPDPITGELTGPLTGAGQDLSPSGLFTYGAVDASGSETPRVEMPADPSLTNVFRGNAFIDALTVQDFTSLSTSALAEGATMTMNVGVQAPPPASVQIGYTTNKFPATDRGWGYRFGTANAGTFLYTVLKDNDKYGSIYLEKWNLSTLTRTRKSLATSWDDACGVAVTSNNIFVLVMSRYTGNTYLYKFDLDMNDLNIFYNLSEPEAADGRIPALGYDSATGELLVAQSRKTNADKVRIRRYSTSGVPGTAVNTTFGYAFDLAGVSYGSFDIGSARYFISGRANQDLRAISPTTMDETPDDSFPAGSPGSGKVGFFWDGVNFKSMDSGGNLRTFEAGAGNRFTSAAGENQWDVGTSYFDSDTGLPAPNNTAETKATTTRFTMTKRARLTITGPTLPPLPGTAAPDSVRFYLKKGSAAHVAGDLWLQGVVTPQSGKNATRVVTDAVFAAVARDVATSSFPNTGVAAKVAATLNGLSVDGNSNGSVGTAGFRDSVRTAVRKADVGIKVASTTDTTNASGVITVTHGIGATPLQVVATRTGFGGANAFELRTGNLTATTFDVQFRQTSANTLAVSGASFSFDWTASY